MNQIPFNKPFTTGDELKFIAEAISQGQFSGDGIFTRKCVQFFEKNYSFVNSFLTTSCTDALELAALTANIQRGDEVIMPSYTFVSTANPFILRGAEVVFADSSSENPNIDTALLEGLITERTRAIVPVHYAGIACDMDPIMELAAKHNLIVIEDAAQGIDSFYKGKSLGSIGDFGAISFHETKNVICGEGGLLVVKDPEDVQRAEIAREKGTNRSAFFRGEVDKYNWVSTGSSYLSSDLLAAFLYGQLIHLKQIQQKRIALWNRYYEELKVLEENHLAGIPKLPSYATNNGHIFYLVCSSISERTGLTDFLRTKGIRSAFHYQALHKSPFYTGNHNPGFLPNAERYSDCLLRLPLYCDLSLPEVSFISNAVRGFYNCQQA